MSTKQQSIIGGITVLGVTGLICKLIAVLYRIPLAWLIGDQGLGTYQAGVSDLCAVMLTISSAGLPVAISRIVSFSHAKGDIREFTRRTFKNALLILSCDRDRRYSRDDRAFARFLSASCRRPADGVRVSPPSRLRWPSSAR